MFAVAGSDKTLTLWDTPSGMLIYVLLMCCGALSRTRTRLLCENFHGREAILWLSSLLYSIAPTRVNHIAWL